MATAVFYGASDDLIEIEGVKGADEFTAEDRVPGPAGSFVLGGQLRVRAYYDQHGLWSFAVSQVADSVPLPVWPIRLSQQPDSGYSTRLEIDCPAETVLIVEKI